VSSLLIGPVGGTLEAPIPSGGTALRYDTDANQYIFNWKTKGLSAGNYLICLSLHCGITYAIQITLN
jgi:hypothetical protein